MRYAILGDIHSNQEALSSVLEAVQKEKPDKLVQVGDIVGYGADPKICLKMVRDAGCTVVAGNHDFGVVGKLSLEFFNSYAQDAALWTRDQLSVDEKKFLGNLGLVEFVDDFTVAHSTFHAPEMFEYIQTSYDAHLSFENLTTPLGFIGHSHVPVTFIQKKGVSYTMQPTVKIDPQAKTIVNVGSIGQPRDENPDAAFALYDSEAATVTIRRVKYDIEKAASKIRKAGLPEILAERLKYGR